MSDTSAAARRYALCCFRLGAGGKETPEVGQARIAHGREQQPCLAADAPSPFDRHRHAFMKPAGQWLAARLTRKREVHDLVPNDRLERVVRIRSGIRADTPGEDRDVMRAGRQAHDPGRSGACACIVFRNERDVDPWRDAEPRAREGPGEVLPIEVPHAVGHLSERRGCVERQLHPAALRRQAGGGQQQECCDSADAVARPGDHPTSLTCRSDSSLVSLGYEDLRANDV